MKRVTLITFVILLHSCLYGCLSADMTEAEARQYCASNPDDPQCQTVQSSDES